MGPEDLNPSKRIILAHDYLQFNGRNWDCTSEQIKGPYGFCNVVRYNTAIQIPIRMAQDILNNVLTSDRKYLKEEHLFYSDGKPAYTEESGTMYRYRKDDGTEMVAVYNTEEDKFIHMPNALYVSILNSSVNKETE